MIVVISLSFVPTKLINFEYVLRNQLNHWKTFLIDYFFIVTDIRSVKFLLPRIYNSIIFIAYIIVYCMLQSSEYSGIGSLIECLPVSSFLITSKWMSRMICTPLHLRNKAFAVGLLRSDTFSEKHSPTLQTTTRASEETWSE